MDVELLIHADWILPVDAADRTLEHHAIAIEHGRIAALVPSAEAEEQIQARTTLRLDGHALLPGLINAHTHAPMSLLRGLADDLPLMTWLHQHIWPAEARWVDADFVAAGTRLALLEMLRGGITCFNDMYFFSDVIARVAAEAGMRAVVGMILINFSSRYAEDIDQYFSRGLALHQRYRDHHLIRTAFSPHSPYAVEEEYLRRVATLAEELQVPVHLHLNETRDEIIASLRDHGLRPLERLERLGLLSPLLLGVHVTQIEDAEIKRLAHSGAHVVHCPESNLKLACGFCPVTKLLEAGVNVALGTDGAASNNDLNMFGEMRTAALLAKGVSAQASAVPAATALRMATLNGARALGLEEVIGSLEPGKSADLIAVDLRDPHTQPIYHVCSQIVYAASSHQVRHVWIAGRQVIRDGEPLTLDSASVLREARAWGERIAEGQRC